MKSPQDPQQCTIQGQKTQRQPMLDIQTQQDSHSQKESFDNEFLIQIHKLHGNKWKKISSYFPDKDDSFVKNYFYSLLRKSLRKLNSYIKSNPNISKVYKPLKLNFVFKLTNLAQMQRNDFTIHQNYKSLLYDFLTLMERNSCKHCKKCKKGFNPEENSAQGKFLLKILESVREIEQLFVDFNLNKKGKSRRKCPKKLEMKRELIQKAQKQKTLDVQSYIESDCIEDPIESIAKSIWTLQSITKRSTELLNVTSDRKIQTRGLQMLASEEHFDPVLFR